MNGARGVIINVTGGPDLSLIEVSEASAIIQEAAHEDANIIFGAVVDPEMEGKVKITVIATGFDPAASARQPSASAAETPVDMRRLHRFAPRRREGGGRRPLAVAAAAVVDPASRARNADRRPRPAIRADHMVSPGSRISTGIAARRAGVPATTARGA